MVEIDTELNPFRIILGKTKSVALMVKITNDAAKTRTMSYDLILGKQLAFEKNGLSSSKMIRLGEMKPNESKIKYFDVFPKLAIQKTPQEITIQAIEHYQNNYDYILGKKIKKIHLRIE